MSSSAVLRSRIRTHICRERGTLACAQSFVRLQGERQRQPHEGDTHEVFSGTANRRLFSSQPLRSKQYHLALTHHVLDHHKLPLGTMTGNQMDAALLSCQQQVEEITPFALHAAERLLQRLQYECASGNFFAQKYSNDLIDLYPKVFHAWIQLAQSPHNRLALLGLESAERLLNDMVEKKRIGDSDGILDACAVASLWMDRDTTGMRSADTLCSLANQMNSSDFSSLSQSDIENVCTTFQDVLHCLSQQVMAGNETCLSKTRSIMDQMELLYEETHWFNMRPNPVVKDNLMNFNEGAVDTLDTQKDGVSEQEVLQNTVSLSQSKQHLEELLASPLDKVAALEIKGTVDDLVTQLRREEHELPVNNDGAVDFLVYFHLIDYYAKILSPRQASQILQRLDELVHIHLQQGHVPEDMTTPPISLQRAFDSVLKLWIDIYNSPTKSDAHSNSARFRVHELMERMEQIHRLTPGLLIESTEQRYKSVPKEWRNRFGLDDNPNVVINEDVKNHGAEPKRSSEALSNEISTLLVSIENVSSEEDRSSTLTKLCNVWRDMFSHWNALEGLEITSLQTDLERTLDLLSEASKIDLTDALMSHVIRVEDEEEAQIATFPMYHSMLSVLKNPDRSLEMLSRLRERYNRNKQKFMKPHCTLYNIAISRWLQSAHLENPHSTITMLKPVLSYYESNDIDGSAQDIADMFESVITVLKNKKAPIIAERTLQLLEKLSWDAKGSPHTSLLRPSHFERVIDAWSEKDPTKSQRPQEAFARLMKRYNRAKRPSHLKPTTALFGKVLEAIAREKKSGYAEKCDAILETMISMCKDSGNYPGDPIKMDSEHFELVINAWKDTGTPAGLERAQVLSRHMSKLEVYSIGRSKESDLHKIAKPSRDASPTSGVPPSANYDAEAKQSFDKVSNMLSTLLELYDNETSKEDRSKIMTKLCGVWRHVFNHWNELGDLDVKLVQMSMERTLDLLSQDGKMNLANTLLSYLTRLEDKEDTQIATFSMYHSIITGTNNPGRSLEILTRLRKRYSRDKQKFLKPHCKLYNAAIAGLLQRSPVFEPISALFILKPILDHYKGGDVDGTSQDIADIFDNALSVLKKMKIAYVTEQVFELLEKASRQKNYSPKTSLLRPSHFEHVIDAWTEKDPTKSRRVQETYGRLMMNYEHAKYPPHLKPTTEIFNKVLEAITREKNSGYAKKCDVILETMLLIHEDKDRYPGDDVKLEDRHFNLVIEAWKDTGTPHSLEKAEALDNRMEK